MMLDCDLFVVFVVHDQAKLGSYVVNTHTQTQTLDFAFRERDRVIKYKINISFVRVFWSLFVFVSFLPLFSFSFENVQAAAQLDLLLLFRVFLGLCHLASP